MTLSLPPTPEDEKGQPALGDTAHELHAAGAEAPDDGPSGGLEFDRLDEAAVFQACFEKAREGMVIVDDDRRYVEANDAACELLGATRSEVLGARVDDFTPAEGREQLELMWRSFLQTGHQAGDCWVERADGDRRECEFKATANVLPGRHLALLRPAEIRRAEEQLAQVRHGLRGMAIALNEVSEGAFLVDRDGCIELLNRAACELLGHDSPKELISHSAHDAFHRARSDRTQYPSEWCPLMRALTSGEATKGEETFVRRDGSFVRVTFSSTPVPLASGSGTLAIFREKMEAPAHEGEPPEIPAPHAA